MGQFKVGRITHYYDKIGVAVVELSADLAVGEKIKFVRGGEDLFEQPVESIQIEHEQRQSAVKGEIVGLKVKQEAKEGADVYKIQ